jgi:hypothetical protein
MALLLAQLVTACAHDWQATYTQGTQKAANLRDRQARRKRRGGVGRREYRHTKLPGDGESETLTD